MAGYEDLKKMWLDHEYVIAPLRSFGRNYFVDVNNGDDSGSGRTPNQAFETIQQAIDVMCALRTSLGSTLMPVCRVYVAPGAYEENLAFSRIVSHWSIMGTGAHPEAVQVIAPAVDSDEELFYTPGASGFKLANMCFKFPVGVTSENAAIQFDIANYGYIEDLRIYGDRDDATPAPDYGIYIGNALGLEIRRNHIECFDEDGVHFHGGADKFASYCEVYENRIMRCLNAGVFKAQSCVSQALQIYNNIIDQHSLDGSYGIYVYDGPAAISGNKIMMGGTGDAIYPAADTAGVISVDNWTVLQGGVAVLERAEA